MLVTPEAIHQFERMLFRRAVQNFDICKSFARQEKPAPRSGNFAIDWGMPYPAGLFLQLTLTFGKETLVEEVSMNPQHKGSELNLLHRSVEELLATESKMVWKEIKCVLSRVHDLPVCFQLTLRSQAGVCIPGLCTLTWNHASQRWALHVIALNHKPFAMESIAPGYGFENSLALQLHHFILKNVNKPLPSTFHLAKMLGTNEHSLKCAFREYFKTSIYQLYTSEKLRRARLLIEHSNIPLHNIAADLGYGDYSTFFRAFYKKYGVSPSDVKRWNQTRPDTEGTI